MARVTPSSINRWPMFPYLYFGPDLVVPTYFLVISFIYSLSSYWLFKRALKFKVPQEFVLEVSLLIMVMGFVGARLCHALVEHPDYYLKAPLQIFKFWQGGFVFYGGAFLAAGGTFYYLKRKKQNIRLWMDLFTPVIIAGYIMGRFATLLSGSGYGRATDVAWAIVYPQGPEAPSGVPLHPTPIYSMLWNSLFLIYVWVLERRSKQQKNQVHPPGNLLLLYGIYHGIGRIVVEQFREDYRGGLTMGFSFSTWVSGILIALCMYFLFAKSESREPT